jgi:outer membrane protein assembly factor BamB
MLSVRRAIAVAGLLGACGSVTAAEHDSWPQWGGPNRNFHVAAESGPWPEGGLPIVWQRDLDEGYSGVVASRGSLFTLGRSGDIERVIALSAQTGKTQWTYEYKAALPAWMRTNHGVGPRSTPLLIGDRLFTVGIMGTLLCLERESGALVWRQDLVADLGGSRNNRGYASSPLAVGDLLIVPVGGKGQALVAFRQASGHVAWKSGDFERGLSSPFLAEIGGQPQILALLDGAVAGFEPSSGRLLWSHPHGGRGERNVSTPVWGDDGRLFVSSAYGGGSRVLRLEVRSGKTEVRQLWADEKVRVMFTNMLRLGRHVYVSSGDFGPVPLTAVAVETGEVAWRDRSFARLNMVKLGRHVLVLDEKASLGLVSLSAEGLTVHSRMQLPADKAWAPPSVAGRRVYVRTNTALFTLELPGAPDAPGPVVSRRPAF